MAAAIFQVTIRSSSIGSETSGVRGFVVARCLRAFWRGELMVPQYSLEGLFRASPILYGRVVRLGQARDDRVPSEFTFRVNEALFGQACHARWIIHCRRNGTGKSDRISRWRQQS